MIYPMLYKDGRKECWVELERPRKNFIFFEEVEGKLWERRFELIDEKYVEKDFLESPE